ncbi:MAG: hypothetical protein FJ202_09685 [Gemmatimonadetes bacterium]|nr:hypothetical protein [Gemmatimonadota bacterium]
MKHFHRTSVGADTVLEHADDFFRGLGLAETARSARARTWNGVVGSPEQPATVSLTVRMEGGHYTFVEVHTTAQGESRVDRNVKKFFVRIHRLADARHASAAAY